MWFQYRLWYRLKVLANLGNSGFSRTLLYNEAKTLALYEFVYQHYHATIFIKKDLRVGAMF